MLEQVEHVWSELEVLNQTAAKRRKKKVDSWISIQITLSYVLSGQICINYRGVTNKSDVHTHLQMKSLKPSDQSSGWWRVGGGFLLKEEMEKINGKIR